MIEETVDLDLETQEEGVHEHCLAMVPNDCIPVMGRSCTTAPTPEQKELIRVSELEYLDRLYGDKAYLLSTLPPRILQGTIVRGEL
tara:strand:+ start:17416 stop:17673 length:258 start_codon:yes stop_codon:yes gene_type:complete